MSINRASGVMQTSLPPGGRIAQSVEQGTENPRVPSSILGPATIFFASSTVLAISHTSSALEISGS